MPVLHDIPGEENQVNGLLVKDTFEPYHAGRVDTAVPDRTRRRKPAEKKKPDAAGRKAEAPESSTQHESSPEHESKT